MDAYKQDEGFTSWLVNQETNPDVKDILEAGGLTYNDFYTVEQAEDIADNVNIEYGGKVIGEPREGYVVVEFETVDKDGNAGKYWQIRTVDNKDVSEELLAEAGVEANGIYSKVNAAVKGLNTLAEKSPTSDTFAFDKDANGKDIMLSYGTEVEDACLLYTSPSPRD